MSSSSENKILKTALRACIKDKTKLTKENIHLKSKIEKQYKAGWFDRLLLAAFEGGH